MSKRQVARGMEGFGEFANEMLATWRVPGAAVAVVKDGEVLLAEGFGLRNMAKRMPATGDTVFAIGSCTKAFAATSVGIAVDDGKLDWDTPVRHYLPEFMLWDAYASEHMTPRDLVSHRSGLPGHDFLWWNAPFTTQDLVERLRYLEPNADFRAVYQYQNMMFMTAGYLVGRMAGTTWGAFVEKRILRPLGMSSTYPSVVPAQASPNVSLPYHEIKGKVVEVPFCNIDNVAGAGSIFSTAADMAQWLLLNLNKGRHGKRQIISERSLKQIHSPQMVVRDSPKYPELLYSNYCMGWFAQPYRGHLLIRHGGRTDGFGAWTSFMPNDSIGVCVLSNVDMVTTPLPAILTYQVYDRLLGLDVIPWDRRLKKDYDALQEAEERATREAILARRPGTHLSHPLAEYVGDFEHPGYGVISVRKGGRGLKATFHNMVFPLEHCHYDVFELLWVLSDVKPGVRMSVTFLTDVKGRISSVSIPLESAVKDIVFTRVADKSRT
jgi:CubicO group peptidase (beta-lactamase class C family)